MNRNAIALTSMAMASALVLSACTDDGAESAEDEELDSAAETDDGEVETEAEGGDEAEADAEESDEEQGEPSDRETEGAGGPSPRLAVTHDDGVAVLDGATLEVLDDFDADGVDRVDPAGDGRHFFLSEQEGFRLIDGGTWGELHGDHNDYFTTDPLLTDVTVDGSAPGQLVSYGRLGTLFFDGSGEFHTFEISELDASAEIETEVNGAEDAHEGLAVVFEDDSRLETFGSEGEPEGVRAIGRDGEEATRNDECSGAQGYAVLPDFSVALGCEGGVLFFDGEFTSADTEDEDARIGGLFPHDDSGILLGEHRTVEDAEGSMTSVALVDTQTEEIMVAEVGSPYTSQSLARGPEGEALVLSEDGALRVIDAESGDQLDELDVVDPWTAPDGTQDARPAVSVVGDIAYITEPDSQAIHMVDLNDLEVINESELDFVPNVMAAVDGRPVDGVSDDFDGDHDDHDGHGDHGDDDEHGDHGDDDEHDDEDDHDHGDDDDEGDDDGHDH